MSNIPLTDEAKEILAEILEINTSAADKMRAIGQEGLERQAAIAKEITERSRRALDEFYRQNSMAWDRLIAACGETGTLKDYGVNLDRMELIDLRKEHPIMKEKSVIYTPDLPAIDKAKPHIH